MKLICTILIFSYAIFLGQAACENNCSYNGVCKNNQCSCNKNYIGSDCSLKAFLLRKDVPLTTNESGKYAVYHIFTETNSSPGNLYFQYNNERSCTVQTYIYQLEPLIIKYYEIGYVSSGNSVTFDLSSEVQIIGNFLIIDIVSKYTSDLTITYSKQEEYSNAYSFQIMLIIFPIILIIIVAITFACCFRRIKRMWSQRNPERIVQPQPVQNPVYLEQKYIVPQQMNIQYPQQLISQFNPSDECPICLQILLNGTPVVITPCQHKFHGNCIYEVLMRQQCCPICRSHVQPNQLIGVVLQNQLQPQLV